MKIAGKIKTGNIILYRHNYVYFNCIQVVPTETSLSDRSRTMELDTHIFMMYHSCYVIMQVMNALTVENHCHDVHNIIITL